MALLAIGACAFTPMKGYPGPALPASETAIVEGAWRTDLVSVDGVKVPGFSVALLPGQHTIEMIPGEHEQRPNYVWVFHSPVAGSITFMAEAGRRYLAGVDFADRPAPGYEDYSKWSWVGYIRDETTRAVAAWTGVLPLGAYPVWYTGAGTR
jgi:hypothetical protein